MRRSLLIAWSGAALSLVVTAVAATPVEFRWQPSPGQAAPDSVALVLKDGAPTPLRSLADAWVGQVDLADGLHCFRFRLVLPDGTARELAEPGNPWFQPDGAQAAWSVIAVSEGRRKVPEAPEFEYFRFQAPDAPQVFLGADFNEWKFDTLPMVRNQDGSWEAWVRQPRPITYKFVIGNEWFTDPDPGAHQMSNDLGSTNSFRPAAGAAEEDLWLSVANDVAQRLAEAEKLGSPEATLKQAAEASRAGQYGRALALTRGAADLAQKQGGPDEALKEIRGRALELEADTHKRFGFPPRAAVAWAQVRTELPGTAAARRATALLGKYQLYEAKDPNAARELLAEAVRHATTEKEVTAALLDVGICYFQEARFEEQLATLNQALEKAPPRDPADPAWCQTLSDVYCYKGIAEARLDRFDDALVSMDMVLAVSATQDTENVRAAAAWREWIVRKRAEAGKPTP